MARIEFYATVKVVCEHDEKGYWSDLPLREIKHAAVGLLQPNFHTIENGVGLKSVEFEFHDDDNKSVDAWNFTSCPDIVMIDNK